MRSRVEQLTGDAHAHLTISRSELHLRDGSKSNVEVVDRLYSILILFSLWRHYRVGDEVADDLLDPVDVHVEDQAPLHTERFVGNNIQTALFICKGQVIM